MNRLLRTFCLAVLGLSLAWGAPASAQSFEGLDLSGSSKKKKKKPSSSSKKKKKGGKTDPDETEAETPAPTEPAPANPAGSTSTPGLDLTGSTPTPGLDLTQPQPAVAPGLDLTQPTPSIGLDLTQGGNKAGTEGGLGLDLTGGKPNEREKLEIAISLFKNEEYEKAAMDAFEIVQDPKLTAQHTEARYVMAKALYRMGLYHASLGQFSKILAQGPETKFFRTGLEWLFFISRKMRNESVILDEIARYSNQKFPDRFRTEFNYLLARYHFVRGRALDQAERFVEADQSFNEVKRLTIEIPKTDAFYARAKYLEGLTYFRNASRSAKTAAARRTDLNTVGSIDAMKEVIRVTRESVEDAEQAQANKKMRELAFMQLARTHYGLQQNRYALFYLGKVERGTSQWLEALFESSWANYRIGEYEQALGNLITLSSPFFRDEYFPEALILKAVIYYENCRYRESNLILQDFERTYLPVHDQLDMLLKKNMDAAEYYSVLADIQKKGREELERNPTDRILERVLRLALTDQDLKKTNDSILELEEEMDSFSKKGDTFRYSELTKQLLEELKATRTTMISKAGSMAKGKLESELVALKRLLANGLRIKFETTTKEKEFLEEQLKAGGRTAIVKKYRYSVAVADDQLYWPYEGEYWRDELGTFQYTLTKGCIERESANRTKPAGESL